MSLPPSIDNQGLASTPTTLYASWFCPYAQRIWIALEEKRVADCDVEINP